MIGGAAAPPPAPHVSCFMFHEVAWILGIFACRWRKLPDPGRHLSKKNSPMQQPFNWMACNSSLCNAGAYPRLELRKRISLVKYYVYWIAIFCIGNLWPPSFCNNDCLLGGMSLLHSYIIGCFITIREGKPNIQVELIHENSNGEAWK